VKIAAIAGKNGFLNLSLKKVNYKRKIPLSG